jgi:hypothetical protein
VPHVNVPFSEEEHRAVKSIAAQVGIDQKDMLRRTFFLMGDLAANRIATLVEGRDGNELELRDGLKIHLKSSREALRILSVMEEISHRLFVLEAFRQQVIDARSDDLPDLQRQARKFGKAWVHPMKRKT